MRALHIIMPLGGLGSRFSSKGYMTPKPLIDVDGKPMFLKALSSFDSLHCEKKYTFIVRYDHIDKFDILNKISSYVPGAKFEILMSNTRGAVETCMKAERGIADGDAVVILDCDLEFYSKSYFDEIEKDLNGEPFASGRLISFTSKDPRYSYAKIGNEGIVIQTAEKNPISDHALAGSYYFSSKKIFTDAACALVDDFNNDRIKTKELYLSLLFNYIIKKNGIVILHNLEKYNSFGTPEELDAYRKKHSSVKIDGHSGCSIAVQDDMVKKSTTDVKYIQRLKNQIEKQKSFKKIIQNSQTYFNVPDVISTEEDENHFSAFMKYINGKSCIEYFETCENVAISNFVSEIINFINFELQQSAIVDVAEQIVKKFHSTKDNVLHNPILAKDDKIISLLNDYEKIFGDLKKCEIPIGISHGDMTMSNMIFTDNEVYMIDFLDSFIETPLMDIVKLRQDTKYNWSYLLANDNSSTFETSKMNFYKIDCEVCDYYSKNEFYKNGYLILQALNFLRILQYAKKKSIIQYLKMILKDLLNEF